MRLRVVLLLLVGGVALGSGLLFVSALWQAEHGARVADATVRAVTPTEGPAAVRRPAPPPSATPQPTPTPEPTPEAVARPVTDPQLALRIAALLDDPELPDGERLALVVVDGNGRTLVEQHADTALIPASSQKLLTAAAALRVFGEDHRFRTEVRATAQPDANGTVAGDLVLVGGGDPALATPTYSAEVHTTRPRTALETLADRVFAAGVRHVRGNVLADSTWLPHEPEAPGWPARYLQQGHASRSSGLTVDAGRRLFTVGGQLRSAPAEDPALEAAAALAELLDERGVRVDGDVANPASLPEAAHHVAVVDSPPLAELLRFTVQRSDNHLADAIYRALGRIDADGSWASGGEATRAALADLVADWDGAVLADGSGLSRDDRLSARLLAQLDVAMTQTAGTKWQGLMAVTGRSGTLRRRLAGTLAEGKVVGKTGSLTDVRSLSGAVVGPDERRYHFAVIGNGLDAAEDAAVRRFQDALVLALAEDLHGCVWVPALEDPGGEEADPARPAAKLRCAA